MNCLPLHLLGCSFSGIAASEIRPLNILVCAVADLYRVKTILGRHSAALGGVLRFDTLSQSRALGGI